MLAAHSFAHSPACWLRWWSTLSTASCPIVSDTSLTNLHHAGEVPLQFVRRRPRLLDSAQILADHQRRRGTLARRADELFGAPGARVARGEDTWHVCLERRTSLDEACLVEFQ